MWVDLFATPDIRTLIPTPSFLVTMEGGELETTEHAYNVWI